jgi:hypothetical protein
MKFLVPLLFALIAPDCLEARVPQSLSYETQRERADLIVIAWPTSIKDTNEVIPMDDLWPPKVGGTISTAKERAMVRGVEAIFDVLTVLKGDANIKHVTLHYYRHELAKDGRPLIVMNGPAFLSFIMPEKPCPVESVPGSGRSYLMFLKNDSNGRYSPLVGQIDPIHSIYQLAFPAAQCGVKYACEKWEAKTGQ